MTTLTNRTPHAVTLFSNGESIIFPASGTVARALNAPQVPTEGINGLPCVTPPEFSGAEGIEGEEAILVSALVAPIAAKVRSNVYSPDTGPGSVVRSEKGEIMGVKRLIRWS
jgi:hypothetical protein